MILKFYYEILVSFTIIANQRISVKRLRKGNLL